MSPLPELPRNLNPSVSLGSARSSLMSATSNFPNLPTLPNSNNIIPQQVSVASKTILGLIEKGIPEKEIDAVIEKYRLPNGTVDLDMVNDDLNLKYERLNQGYAKIVEGLQATPVSLTVSGILAGLVPKIPSPNIPSPAEIRQYINNIIEKKKRQEQQIIMRAQRLAAAEEELPFTARNTLQNNT